MVELITGAMRPRYGSAVDMDDDTRDLQDHDDVIEMDWLGNNPNMYLRVRVPDDAEDVHELLTEAGETWVVETYEDYDWNDYADYEVRLEPRGE